MDTPDLDAILEMFREDREREQRGEPEARGPRPPSASPPASPAREAEPAESPRAPKSIQARPPAGSALDTVALPEEDNDEPEKPAAPIQGWVVFVITHSRLNPDQITTELGLEPDRSDYTDPLGRHDGFWQLNSTLSGDETLETHFWNILTRLTPVHKKLWEMSQKMKLSFYCTIQKASEQPMEPVVLPAKLLLLLGYIGAEIDVEVVEKF